jgi:hypothetical protein
LIEIWETYLLRLGHELEDDDAALPRYQPTLEDNLEATIQ